MLLKKIFLTSFVVFSLNFPVSITAKEVPSVANRKPTTNTETKVLANKTNQNGFTGEGNSSEQVFPEKNYMLNSLEGFEEIVTKVDSGRVVALLPTIPITVDSYQNHFEPGHKAQRILQELLPLNIF